MTLVVACLVVLAFVAVCHALKVVTLARHLVANARRAMTVVREPTLEDAAKERAAKRAAIGLFGGFVSITLRSAVAALASAAVIYLADLAGLVPAAVTLARLASWDFIIVTAVVLSAGYLAIVWAFPQVSRR